MLVRIARSSLVGSLLIFSSFSLLDAVQRRLAVEELAVLRNRIRQAISDGLAQLDRSRHLVRLYDQGILVQAEGSLESALAAYRNDRRSLW